MRGHIVKRYENSYTIVLNMGFDPVTGKRKQQWVSVKGTKKEAEKRLAELLHQLDTGTFVRPEKTTVAEYLTRWLRDYAQPNLSARGFERYRDIITRCMIPDFGSIPLAQLRPEHLQKHYGALLNSGRSPGTARYHHAVIHKALSIAVRWNLVSRNVADNVDAPKKHHTEMQVWDEADVNKFLKAAKDSPYYALFFTALYTGMRRSELLGLAWKDADFIFGQISVTRGLHQLKDGSYVFAEPKTAGSRRTIALPPEAIGVLAKHREQQERDRALLGHPLTDEDLVFSTIDAKPLRPNTITRAWSMLAKKTGLKVIRLHDARHTHASLLLKWGVSPKVCQERLGHADIGTTLNIYGHVMPGMQQAAADLFGQRLNGKAEKEGAGKVG